MIDEATDPCARIARCAGYFMQIGQPITRGQAALIVVLGDHRFAVDYQQIIDCLRDYLGYSPREDVIRRWKRGVKAALTGTDLDLLTLHGVGIMLSRPKGWAAPWD